MPPKDAENLSQGDETIELAIRMAVTDSEMALSRDEYYEAVVALSWNEIISCLGPMMIDRASESDLSRTVVKYFKDRWGESLFKDRSWKIGYSKLRMGSLPQLWFNSDH